MKQALATDLDGTLIPLEGHQENLRDLQSLKNELNRTQIELLYVTGRHFESVADAIESYQLPLPGWVICDVGTTVMQRTPQGTFEQQADYREQLVSLTQSLPLHSLELLLENLPGLRRQEEEKQGEFKLSYYCDDANRIEISEQIRQLLRESSAPYSLISSADPFNGDGLIDLLPQNVSKAYALDWWTQFFDYPKESILFAGDSGNDLAALTAGYRSILVGNAAHEVVEEVTQINKKLGFHDRLFLAESSATSGVLSGCNHFGIFRKTSDPNTKTL